ncbi:MAG: DUF2147 domain-containing protein [Alphaproteobacteria bacterium]
MGRSSLIAVLFAGAAALVAGPALAADILGRWATEEEKSHVEIVTCADAPEMLCGTIVWLREPNDDAGQPKTDRNNPDEALRGRPIIGLPLLSGFIAGQEPNVWEDGKIYNPEDGEVYSCVMTLMEDGSLVVRGYVGIPLLGESQVWTRVPRDS